MRPTSEGLEEEKRDQPKHDSAPMPREAEKPAETAAALLKKQGIIARTIPTPKAVTAAPAAEATTASTTDAAAAE